jgi:putative Holliday junction resolvase
MNKEKSKNEIVLGIDHGESRTGLALGRNGLASPIRTVSGKSENEIVNEIAKTAVQNKVQKVVIGLPLSHDGKETTQSRKVRRFSKLLKIRMKLPTEFVDEYGTTGDAETESFNAGLSKKSRRTIDHYSATFILKHYYSQE